MNIKIYQTRTTQTKQPVGRRLTRHEVQQLRSAVGWRLPSQNHRPLLQEFASGVSSRWSSLNAHMVIAPSMQTVLRV
jgi:hypothetical protein